MKTPTAPALRDLPNVGPVGARLLAAAERERLWTVYLRRLERP